MRIRLIGTGIALLLSLFTARAFDNLSVAEAPRYRTLRVTLLDPNGKPAPNVWVGLRGLDRDAMAEDTSKPADGSASPWHFKSDAHGRFTVRFGRFRTWESKTRSGEFSPGWGEFHLYAQARLGCAVSDRIVNPAEDPEVNYATGDWGNKEWGGHTAFLKRGQMRMTMQFKPGLRLLGCVVDTAGHPAPNIHVSVYHDLGADTHTGHGGEILWKEATTQRDGSFVISGIYPNKFHLSLPYPEEEGYWVRTKIREKWANEIVDEITPHPDEAVIRAKIVVSPTPPYLYHGRVTDPAGNPIAKAKVNIGVSMHRRAQSWEDHHHFRDVWTDSDGRYEFRAEAPFVRGFSVEAEGFGNVTEWFDERPASRLAPPGVYNFSLQRGSKAVQK